MTVCIHYSRKPCNGKTNSEASGKSKGQLPCHVPQGAFSAQGSGAQTMGREEPRLFSVSFLDVSAGDCPAIGDRADNEPIPRGDSAHNPPSYPAVALRQGCLIDSLPLVALLYWPTWLPWSRPAAQSVVADPWGPVFGARSLLPGPLGTDSRSLLPSPLGPIPGSRRPDPRCAIPWGQSPVPAARSRLHPILPAF